MGNKRSKPEIQKPPTVETKIQLVPKPKLVEHRQQRSEHLVTENPFYIPNLNDEDCEKILMREKYAFLFRDSTIEGELIFSFINNGQEIGT